MDTMLHDNAAFPDRYKADGTTLTEAFTLLDRFLAQLLIGKLSPEVRTVYLAQRALSFASCVLYKRRRTPRRTDLLYGDPPSRIEEGQGRQGSDGAPSD